MAEAAYIAADAINAAHGPVVVRQNLHGIDQVQHPGQLPHLITKR